MDKKLAIRRAEAPAARSHAVPAVVQPSFLPAIGRPNFDPRALIIPAAKVVTRPGRTFLELRDDSTTFGEVYAR